MVGPRTRIDAHGAIEAHLRQGFPGQRVVVQGWQPDSTSPTPIRVFRVDPATRGGLWLHVSSGGSAPPPGDEQAHPPPDESATPPGDESTQPPGDEEAPPRGDESTHPPVDGTADPRDGGPGPSVGHEFVLVTPFKTLRAVELLAMVVYFHREEQLTVGATVSVGEPWLPGSACKHLLVSKPYLLADRLWTLCLPDREVLFQWVIPITTGERAYGAKHGLEALEQRFEEEGMRYWHPHRASVV